jgi:hypothetical protein
MAKTGGMVGVIVKVAGMGVELGVGEGTSV